MPSCSGLWRSGGSTTESGIQRPISPQHLAVVGGAASLAGGGEEHLMGGGGKRKRRLRGAAGVEDEAEVLDEDVDGARDNRLVLKQDRKSVVSGKRVDLGGR